MSNTTTSKLTVLGLAFLVLGVLLPGCGSQMGPTVSDVQTKVFEPMCAGVNEAMKPATHPAKPSDGGGWGLAETCSSYVVEISGSAEGTDAVFVNVDGQDLSVSVNSDGTFSAIVNVTDPSLDDLSVTPM